MINKIDIDSSQIESGKVTIQFSTRLCLPYGDLFNDTDESIHFERHSFEIHSTPFSMKYFLNDQFMCNLNSLGLLSIERTRKENARY